MYSDIGNLLYRGDFSNGLKSGVGVEFYQNGNKMYEGQWQSDNWNGWGKWYTLLGDLKYQGQFKNGKTVKKFKKVVSNYEYNSPIVRQEVIVKEVPVYREVRVPVYQPVVVRDERVRTPLKKKKASSKKELRHEVSMCDHCTKHFCHTCAKTLGEPQEVEKSPQIDKGDEERLEEEAAEAERKRLEEEAAEAERKRLE